MRKLWNRAPRLKALARSAACLLAAAALLLAPGCGKGGRDDEAELTGRERVKAELRKALTRLDRAADPGPKDSSLDLTVSLELADGSYNGVDLNDYLRDSSIGLKMDAQKDRVGLEGDLVVMGDRVIGGTAIYDDGVLGFQVPELDSTYYTVDLEALLSQSYEGRQYLEMIERMEDMNALDLPTEELLSVLDRYIDVIADTSTKDNTTTEKADFSFEKLEGDENSGKVWVFTPAAQDVEDFLDRLAGELENDRDLSELALDLAVQLSDMVGYTPTDEEKDELQEEMAQGLQDAAEELRQSAEEAGQAVEEAGFTCALYSAKNGAWKMEVAATLSDGAGRFCAEGCENGFAFWIENEDEGSTPFELVFQYEEEGGAYSGAATCSVDDGRDAVSAELAFEDVTDKTSALDFNYGSYTLTIPNLGRVCLDVTEAASGGTDHVLSLDVPALSQACAREGLPDFNGARLTLRTTDKKVSIPVPSGPSRSLDLMNMDQGEMEEVFGPWEQRLEEIANGLAAKLSAAND